MIYITGDTHGEFGRFSNKRMKKHGLDLDENDYVIVCGDFGLCWETDGTFKYNCRNFEEKRYTILWIQGNHENYDQIHEYPIEEWHGGKVRHIVRDKVILLERGQVFDIDGSKFFTFGGASSHDIQGGLLDPEAENYEEELRKARRGSLPFRIKNVSWWEAELPNEEELNEGLRNLEKCDYKVDYVLTHCCSTSVQELVSEKYGEKFEPDILTDYLQKLEEKLEYKHWFFGHYHKELDVDEKHTLLYHAIVPLEGHGSLENIPVKGHPRYCLGDIVSLKYDENIVKTGRIVSTNAWGNFENKDEPSYDILIGGNILLMKGVPESDIIAIDRENKENND